MGLLPIVEVPYAKYLDCGADMFFEAAIMNWLTAGATALVTWADARWVRRQATKWNGDPSSGNTLLTHCPQYCPLQY